MGESIVSDSFFCGEFFLVILLSAERLKTSFTGKRKKKKREREREKETNKTKQTKQNKTKQRRVSSGSIYCKSLDFPCSFPALLGQELALPLSFQLIWAEGGVGGCAAC